MAYRHKIIASMCLLMMMFSAQAQDLKQTYHQVLQNDPRLLISSLGVEVGHAREQQAFGTMLPQVSVSSVLTENKRKVDGIGTSNYPGERYAISLKQTLFDVPKYKAWQKSELQSEQFENEYQAVLDEVRYDTVRRYFDLLSAEDELRLTQDEKQATEKKFKQVEALYNKQLAKITDYLEVTARLDMLASQEVDAMQKVGLARESLSELTSNPVEFIVPLIDSEDYIVDLSPLGEYERKFSAYNPSLKALQSAIDAAQKKLEEQKARRYPVVDLQLSKQKSNIGYENALTQKSETDVLALNFSMPLYTGGMTSGYIREASQQVLLSQAAYDQEYRKLLKELKDLFLGVKAVTRRIEATKKAISSAEKSYQAMNKSFELGISTVSDVLDAQQVFLQAKRSYQQAKYDYILDRVGLMYISGELTEEAFYEISDWLV
jgi:outer membrane protein